MVELGIESTFQVVMSRGQAHAPIFTAKLTVPQVFFKNSMFKGIDNDYPMLQPWSAPVKAIEAFHYQGHVVTATGSSKKIAKNLAAKMMLDKLEEVAISSVY